MCAALHGTAIVCPPIIGNVHVYFDDNHVTATYSRSMASLVGQAVEPILSL